MIPSRVFKMCRSGALIAGSYARYLVEGDVEPRDLDILVPAESWSNVSGLIPENARLNKFGGWKFQEGRQEIDVWPQSVVEYLRTARSRHSGPLYVVDIIYGRTFTSSVLQINPLVESSSGLEIEKS